MLSTHFEPGEMYPDYNYGLLQHDHLPPLIALIVHSKRRILKFPPAQCTEEILEGLIRKILHTASQVSNYFSHDWKYAYPAYISARISSTDALNICKFLFCNCRTFPRRVVERDG